ncbi:penicillin-binding protein 1C [Candidatus Poribacteria bacterium]|nr:penicillin-binding protein 1C [Candidatus Poribacteria bacterium]
MRNCISLKRLLIFLAGGILVFGLSFRFTPLLFPIQKEDIKQKSFHSVKFYDRDGNLLQEVLSKDSRSLHVSIDHVSPYFLNAIIASEDKNFYYHKGIDYLAVLRAIYQNIKSKEIASGASTITLQLARMINPGKRTMIKKTREAYFAYRLEAGMDKKAILEEYINRIPMGGNLYGVESAAKAYFGLSASDLTLAQATFLASIPNSPIQLNPYHNLKGIKKRQEYILEKMCEQGLIPKERLERVLKENVALKPQEASFLAPHFVFQVMDNLAMEHPDFIGDEVFEVKTTIDREMQKMVGEQIRKAVSKLKRLNVTNAAAILLDNHTGQVLAYVGSADYFDEEHEGQNNGIMAARQPGSTLKPFLYLLAMEEGFNPATIISDIPVHYRMPKGIYSPKNYSEKFHGPVSLREALANSLNVPAAQVSAKIGVKRFLDRLHEYGFDSLNQDADYYGIGLALGGGEVTLYELARAYMCLARMGSFIPIREILTVNGKDSSSFLFDQLPSVSFDQTFLFKRKVWRKSLDGKSEINNVFSMEKTISTLTMNYLIADILSDRFARASEFGFNSILNLPFPCAVKTGTSFRSCDNWTVGYTQDYTLGIWVGNFNHSPMQKVSGVSGAGPLFAKIMMTLYGNKKWPAKFTMPEGLVKVPVCSFSGKNPNQNCPAVIEEIIPTRDLSSYEKESCEMHICYPIDVRNGLLASDSSHFIKGGRGNYYSNEAVQPEVFTVLPTKYQKWAEDLRIKTPPELSPEKEFAISNPKDGAIYRRLSNLLPEYQSIKIELRDSIKDDEVKWFLNDVLLRTTYKEHAFLWQIKPGDYALKAVSGKNGNLSDMVKFMVK